MCFYVKVFPKKKKYILNSLLIEVSLSEIASHCADNYVGKKYKP